MILNSFEKVVEYFYYEVTTLWKGKSTIKVKDGIFGWSDEDL